MAKEMGGRASTGDFGKGRGKTAVADMKSRLAAMKNSGMGGDEIFSALWDRNRDAVVNGKGFTYEYAE